MSDGPAMVLEGFELPTDRSPAAPRSVRRGWTVADIPGAAVADAADEIGADERHVCLAALWVFLHRYAGRRSLSGAVRVRTPEGSVDTRQQLGGFTDGDSFAELVRTVASAAPAQADEPASETASGGVRSLPGVMFCWLQGVGSKVPDDALTEDWTVAVVRSPEGLSIRGGFATDLFDPATAERMAKHYVNLLTGLVRDPQASIGGIRMVGADEAQTVARLNNDSCDVPDRPFHELVQDWARTTPDAIAVRSRTGVLSYGRLNALANQLAVRLTEHGVAAETPVAITMERSERTIVAVLGVLKAGGCFVPVAPDDPADRQSRILLDAGVGIVVTEPGVTLPPIDGLKVVLLDATWSELLDLDPVDPPEQGSDAAGRAAYLLYTSGSTGQPKGVVVEHRQLVSYAFGFAHRTGVQEPLSFALVQPLTVDSSLTAIAVPLCTGGQVHVLSREQSLDANLLADWGSTWPVDCLKIAPSHLRALQSSGRFAELLPRRLLVVGGEASDWTWLRQLQRSTTCRVFNHYGPTETTVGVLMHAVDQQPDSGGSIAPVGVPLPNVRAEVLDAGGHEVPFGTVGELTIAGATVARGYHGLDEASGPFSATSSGRVYRTGDLACRRADGVIEFLGRTDDQVKIRGFRITLGEIDVAVGEHPSVGQAVTVTEEDSAGGRRVVAYVVAAEEARLDLDDLADFVQRKVPSHMVPQDFVVLDELPRSPHGKIDRQALPKAATRAAGGPVAGSGMEQLVATAWAQLLGLPSVGIDQNFFDLGGHSLLLIELQQRLQAGSGRAVEVLDLFEHPTVRSQATLLTGGGAVIAAPARSGGRQQAALAKRRAQQLRSGQERK